MPRRVNPLKPKVPFICWGNSCRSIMAEALARHFFGEVLEAVSAGLQPLGFITRETLEVLAEIGVATAGLRSKGLEEIDLEGCALLVNLSDHRLDVRIPFPLRERLVERPVADPYGGDLVVYRQTQDAIRRLLASELAAWLSLA
jgi:arsenate reductase (thioredoxin)